MFRIVLLLACFCCNYTLAQDAQQYEQSADSALGMRNYDLAISLYQNALNSSPNDADLKAKQGLAYMERGDLAQGNKLFEEAIKQNPQKIAYWVYRLDVLVRKKDVGQARQVVGELQKRGWNPINDAMMSHTMGNFYVLEGKPQEAHKFFEQAVEKVPQSPIFQLELAKNQKALQQYKEAYFSAFKSLELGYPQALNFLLELRPNLPPGITAETPENQLKEYYVHDLTNQLNWGDLNEINKQLKHLHYTKGVQIGVAVLPTLGGKTDVELAEQICKVWNLNYQSKTGLLVLVAIEDKKMRLHVLAEMKEQFSDAEAVALIQTYLRPAFKEGDYSKGLTDLVQALEARVNGETLPTTQTEASKPTE
ncbi:MAG: hypothetical protein EAZ95_12150, partial [Bacteroidetes bacterium]